VCAKRFVKHFTGFSLSTRAIGHGLFNADDLMALRALAEAMTRAIDFFLWPKPSHVGQFWLFHAPVSHTSDDFGYVVLAKCHVFLVAQGWLVSSFRLEVLRIFFNQLSFGVKEGSDLLNQRH
jgi:hypothetical protein